MSRISTTVEVAGSIGGHAEEVRHADWRDHHRKKKDHPEEAAPWDVLHDQDGEAQREQVLNRHVDADVDERDDERSGPPARQHRIDDEPYETTGDDRCEQPSHESEHGGAGAPQVANEEKCETAVDDRQDRTGHWSERYGHADEMRAVDADHQLRVVVETDKAEVNAALREGQASKRD